MLDKLRAELVSDREAFEKEKRANEALFQDQQEQMRELQASVHGCAALGDEKREGE